jgi:ribose transport system permease protein
MTSGENSRLAVTREALVKLPGEPVWIVLVVLVLVMAVISDVFLTPDNLLNVLRQVSIIGVIAVGVTIALIGGNFDLSVGATLTLAAVVSIDLQPNDPFHTALAIVIPLALGLTVGLFNGLIIGGLRANSIIVTVGMQFAVIGCVLLYVSGQHVRVDNATAFYTAISEGYTYGVPNPVYMLAMVVFAGHIVMTRTVFGRHVLAIGGNIDTARLAGIATARSIAVTFMISGLFAAVGGILVASRVRNLDPTAGIGYEFATLTAVVLGGTQLSGGKGSMLNTLAGVLILGVLSNSMTLLAVSHNTQLLVQGLILVSAVAYGSYRGSAPS